MDLITPDIMKNILALSGESSDMESVLSSASEAAVGHAENFCSNIIRVHLKLKLTSGEIFMKPLVLKVFLKNLDDATKQEMKEFFANEATMYEKILINLETLAKKHNLKHPRIWPECYFANTDLVVFDDLNVPGFRVEPRHNGLSLEVGLRVISYIGRFHALSVVAERKKLIDPLIIRRTYTWAQIDNWMSKYIKKALITAGNKVKEWGNEWEDVGHKIVDYSNRISKVLNDLYLEDVELRVVNHGDAWINNILVKYDENKQVDEVRFVDFQNATYNSGGWDLVFFLYSSLQGELMRTNYEKLLTSYRDEFVHTLQSLGEDTSIAPSLDQIKAEIVRLHPFCLTVASAVQCNVFSVSKESIQIDELLSDDKKLSLIYSSDNWKSSYKVHIKYFLKQNIF